MALVARRTDRLEELAASITADGGTRAHHHRRRHRPGAGGAGGGDRRRAARPARHRGQQRRRDAARPDRRRPARGVGADGRPQRQGPALRRPRLAPAPAERPPSPIRAGWPTWSTSPRWPAGSPRNGSGVYNATKHAVGAFSESLRQEVTARHVRVSLVEPGAVATELGSHNRPEIQEGLRQRFGGDGADGGRGHRRDHRVHRHPAAHVAVNEVLIRPTEQEG